MNKTIFVAMFILLGSICLQAQTQDTNTSSAEQQTAEENKVEKKKKKKQRTVALWGHVKNSFTKVGIPNTLITLMNADSTVIDTFRVRTYGGNTYKLGTNYRYMIPAVPKKYICLLYTSPSPRD